MLPLTFRLEVDWATAFVARCSPSPSRLLIVNTTFGYSFLTFNSYLLSLIHLLLNTEGIRVSTCLSRI